jgi:hypothetical protein
VIAVVGQFTPGMPTSRKRTKNQKHRSIRRAPHTPRSGRGHMVDFAVLFATDDAEARGDAEAALQLIERHLADHGDLRFWRPDRMHRLLQLQMFKGLLPGWATSRWILAQAAQSLQPAMREKLRRAERVAIEMRGDAGGLIRGDDLDARAKVMDHDWVYRQVLLYELGGLDNFLRRCATPDLLAGADRIHDWARAEMAGFRLQAVEPRTLTWVDLRTGNEVQSINIGSASLLEPNDTVIGRLVPISGGAMFESAPLLVPGEVAQIVAEDPGSWVAALTEGCRRTRGTFEWINTAWHRFPLLTDVPDSVAHHLVPDELRDWLDDPDTSSDQNTARELQLVRAALNGLLDYAIVDDPWPVVGALLLDPDVFTGLAESLVPSERPKLMRLAESLADPAATLCRVLATAAR